MSEGQRGLPACHLDERPELRLTVRGAGVRALVRPAIPAHSAATPIIFVHGGGASGVWWDACTAVIDPAHAVVAIDLSGHGNSDWRPEYSARAWIEEIIAVAEALRLPGALLVGHSLGGALAVAAAAQRRELFSAVVTVDGNPGGPPRGVQRRVPTAAERERRCDDRGTLIANFARLKAHWADPLGQYVAERSVRHDARGWSYKRDAATFATPVPHTPLSQIGRPPLLFVHGQDSPFLQRDSAYVLGARSAGRDIVGVTVPDAGHEVMMQRPFETMRVISNFTAGEITLSAR